MSAPFLLVPKGGFMMTVSARNLLCIPSAPTSHRTKSTCMQQCGLCCIMVHVSSSAMYFILAQVNVSPS